MIETMNDIGEGTSKLAEEAVEEIRRSTADLIPACVRASSAWASSQALGGEPCPCGSGRSYERCCGSN